MGTRALQTEPGPGELSFAPQVSLPDNSRPGKPVPQDRAAKKLLQPQAWPFVSTPSPAGIKALTYADKSFFQGEKQNS